MNTDTITLVLAGIGVISMIILLLRLFHLIVPAKIRQYLGKIILETLATVFIIFTGAFISQYGSGLLANKLLGLPWSWTIDSEHVTLWQWLVLLTGGISMFFGIILGYWAGSADRTRAEKGGPR